LWFLEGKNNQKAYISIDIHNLMLKNSKNYFERSPTLNTVMMVEETIEKYSGEYKKRDLWQRLPKKVMWQTYLIILDYLESINKIAFDREETIAYIWNPKLTKVLAKRPEIKLK